MRGFFGPEGTFTHQALLEFGECGDPVPYPTVTRALDAVRAGEVDTCVVPIENSIEGSVSATLDYLALRESPLQILGERVLDVEFNLYVRPGTKTPSSVMSHPHAIAQVRGWLGANLPDAVIVDKGSTAGAAEAVARGDVEAAVCAPVAGDMHGLEARATNIGDNSGAKTRFVLVGRPQRVATRTGHDKTTVVCYMRQDRPGGLLEILQQFAVHGVNLCRIESRPTKQALGEYCFSMDAEGHMTEPRLGESLRGLRRVCKDVIFLGSYERADGKAPKIPFGGTDADYEAAEAWLRGVHDGETTNFTD